MTPSYEVAPATFKPCIDYLVDAGMGPGNAVYVALGAGGEHMMLSTEERKLVAESAVAASAGRLPVFVGVASNSTREAVELARHADHIGADGLQVEPPYYFNCTAQEIFEYFQAISEAVSIGITAYNTPWASGFHMDSSFLDRLAGLDNVIGLKWYADSSREYVSVIRRYSRRFNIVNNYGGVMNADAFLHGVVGFVSQAANFAPRVNLRILALLRAKQFEAATELYMQSENLYYDALGDLHREGFSGEGNFIKACMPLVGLDCGPARLPQRRPSPWFADRMRQMIESVGEFRLAVH